MNTVQLATTMIAAERKATTTLLAKGSTMFAGMKRRWHRGRCRSHLEGVFI